MSRTPIKFIVNSRPNVSSNHDDSKNKIVDLFKGYHLNFVPRECTQNKATYLHLKSKHHPQIIWNKPEITQHSRIFTLIRTVNHSSVNNSEHKSSVKYPPPSPTWIGTRILLICIRKLPPHLSTFESFCCVLTCKNVNSVKLNVTWLGSVHRRFTRIFKFYSNVSSH